MAQKYSRLPCAGKIVEWLFNMISQVSYIRHFSLSLKSVVFFFFLKKRRKSIAFSILTRTGPTGVETCRFSCSCAQLYLTLRNIYSTADTTDTTATSNGAVTWTHTFYHRSPFLPCASRWRNYHKELLDLFCAKTQNPTAWSVLTIGLLCLIMLSWTNSSFLQTTSGLYITGWKATLAKEFQQWSSQTQIHTNTLKNLCFPQTSL